MNLRVQYPLWNIIIFFPLLPIGWGVISLEGVNKDSDFGILLQWSVLVGVILLALISLVYMFVVIRNNKKNPRQKVNPLSFIPNEYVEYDEMFKQVTMGATKKIYSFMYWALPTLLGVTLVAENRFTIYLGLIVILIIQNLIYYKEMKHYVSG